MKNGNWKSRKARKRDLNGCHRGGAPMHHASAPNHFHVARPGIMQAVQAYAMAAIAALGFGRRGNR